MSLINVKNTQIMFIAGPTASGKTAVGISLAKKLNGEIISCDSMQVYDGIAIASNKPLDHELEEVPHHLISSASLEENFDVARFESIAKSHIQEILTRRKIPIVVGGTGLYMKVLLDGIFKGKDDGGIVREQIEKELFERGCEALYQELNTVDPEAAQKIHLNDERRIVRAIEVYRQTGKPISQLQKESSGLWGRYDIRIFGLMMDRGMLYERIDRRVDEMFERGLIDEVKSLEGISLSQTAQAIIGIKEVRAYLEGECSLEEAKDDMKKNTRHLAKRQLTWFRAEDRLEWIEVSGQETADQIAEKIIQRISI